MWSDHTTFWVWGRLLPWSRCLWTDKYTDTTENNTTLAARVVIIFIIFLVVIGSRSSVIRVERGHTSRRSCRRECYVTLRVGAWYNVRTYLILGGLYITHRPLMLCSLAMTRNTGLAPLVEQSPAVVCHPE